VFGPDGDDVAVVEPDAFEDGLEHVPFRFRVGLVAPEEGEVVEDLLGLVEVGKWFGCEFGTALRLGPRRRRRGLARRGSRQPRSGTSRRRRKPGPDSSASCNSQRRSETRPDARFHARRVSL
jgi:hypothetical protein